MASMTVTVKFEDLIEWYRQSVSRPDYVPDTDFESALRTLAQYSLDHSIDPRPIDQAAPKEALSERITTANGD